MKILYVNKVSPRFGGGAELRLHEIGKRLVNKGYKVCVVCGKTEPHLPDSEEIDGMKVYYVKTIPEFLFRFRRLSFYLSRYLFYFLSIQKIYRVGRSVNLIVDDLSPAPSFAYLIGKIQKKTVYATIHEFFSFGWFKSMDPVSACLSLLSHYLLKLFIFDSIITVSQFTKNRLVKFGLNPERIFVIPNGIDLPSFNKSDGHPSQNNSLAILGRLVKQKGHIYLIEAMKRVVKEVPDAKLNVIGDGPLRSSLEAKVREYRLDTNIVFRGGVADQEKFKMLCSSNIFVLPSLKEGFGIVLLEAMACGLPIVANDLPVLREVSIDGQNGYLVDVKNPEELAGKIVVLLKDEQRRKEMGKYNREYVKQFNWDRIADMEEKVLLGGK